MAHRVRLAHAGGDQRRIEVDGRDDGPIVGIDTSHPSTSVAVLGAGRLVRSSCRDDPAAAREPAPRRDLQPLLEQALEQAQVTWEDVARICVGTGPGGFTGLRLGVSTARALAQGRDLPVVGVSSLEALARGVELVEPERARPARPPRGLHGPVLAVIDARRGEVFAAVYRHHRTTMEPTAIDPGRAGRAPGRAARVGAAARCWPWATGRYAFGRSSNGPEWRCRPTVPAPTASAP